MQVKIPNFQEIYRSETFFVFQMEDDGRRLFTFLLEGRNPDSLVWKIDYPGFWRVSNRSHTITETDDAKRDAKFRETIQSCLEEIYSVDWNGEDAFSHPDDTAGYIGGNSLAFHSGKHSLPKQECTKQYTLKELADAIQLDGRSKIELQDNITGTISLPSRDSVGKDVKLTLYETEDGFITIVHNSLYPSFYRKIAWPEQPGLVMLELWRISEVLEDLSLD